MSNLKLYQIPVELEKLFEPVIDDEGNESYPFINPETGELTPEGLELFNELNLAKEQKLAAIKWMFLEFESIEEQATAEIKRLQALKKQAQDRQEKLKKYVSTVLQGVPEKSVNYNYTFRKSESVEVGEFVNLIQLNKDFPNLFPKEVKIEIKPDKTAIKKHLKSGNEINGVNLVESLNLQIK